MSLLPLIGMATQVAGRAQILRTATRPLRRILGRKGRRAPAAAPAGGGILETAGAVVSRLRGGRAMAMPGMPRRRRRRGISGVELRGFKKVARLLADVGMAPRGLGRARRARRPFSARRLGDPFEEGLD